MMSQHQIQHHGSASMAPHINGYVWDQREQRFYRLNADPTSPPNPRLFSRQQPFLDQGLPNHTNSEHETARIKQLMQQQRPMSVGPVGHSSASVSQQLAAASMMGRPNSTLPTSVNKNPSFFNNAQIQAPSTQANNSAQNSQHMHQLNEHNNTETIIAERETAWQKRRHSFTKRNEKIKRNVAEITAQDLLGKSHEELVLLLIHLRRQSVALAEAVDASRAEVENFANAAANNSDGESGIEAKAMLEDSEVNLKELEERLRRVQPMIKLVENMVKLGSLYNTNGPADSHMTGNGPSKVVKNDLQKERTNSQTALETELKKVHHHLELNQRLLEDLAVEHSEWDQEVK